MTNNNYQTNGDYLNLTLNHAKPTPVGSKNNTEPAMSTVGPLLRQHLEIAAD